MMEIKADEREQWWRLDLETMRLQTFYLINIQLKEKDKISSPEKLMPFSWDKKHDEKFGEYRPFTDEEARKYDDDFPVGGIGGL